MLWNLLIFLKNVKSLNIKKDILTRYLLNIQLVLPYIIIIIMYLISIKVFFLTGSNKVEAEGPAEPEDGSTRV